MDECALPLIIVNESVGSSVGSSFEVNPDAIRYLQSIRTKVAVVSIAGLYRTGKSYLLNKVMGHASGFTVGPTVKACTKGIWIWGKAVRAEGGDCHVLFLDTEGLGSTIRGASYDSRVFSLAILLSSVFVYNSTGVIDGDAISRLSLVVNLTKHIHVRATTAEHDSGMEFASFFPSFLWIVRDFGVKLERDGRRLTSKEYLEDALKQESGLSEATQDKNAVRAVIRNFFPERDCVTMVRPVTDEAALNSLASIPDDEIRPEFLSQVEALRKRILSSAKPKMLYGKPLNGAMFATLVQEYCDALNADKTPVIKNAWERVADSQCSSAADAAVEIYKSILKSAEAREDAVYSVEEIDALDRQATAAANDAYRRGAIADGETFAEHETEYLSRNSDVMKAFKRRNAAKADDLCEKLFDSLSHLLQQAVEKGFDSAVALSRTFSHEFLVAVDGYTKKAQGPQPLQLLVSRLPDVVSSSLLAGAETVDAQHATAVEGLQVDIASLKAANQDLSTQISANAAEHAKACQDFANKLEIANQHAHDEKSRMSELLAMKSDELSRLSSKLDTMASSVESNVSKAAFAAAELSLCQRSLEEAKSQAASQLASATARISALEAQLAEKDANLQSWMVQSRQDSESAKSELQGVATKHQREIDDLTARHSSEVVALRAQLTEAQDGFDRVSSKLEKAEREFSAELETFREQLRASQAYSQSLEGYLTAAKTASSTTIDELGEQVRQLQSIVAGKEQQAVSMQSEVESLREDIALASTEISKSRETCDSLRAELTTTEASLRQVESKVVELQASLHVTTSDKNRVAEECAELKLRLQAAGSELESCKAALERAQQQSDAMIADRDARMSTQFEEFKKSVEAMTSSSGSVLEQLLALERNTTAALTEQTAILSQQMESKEALVRQLGEQVASLQTQRLADQHDLMQVRHENDVLKTKLSTLEPQVYSVEAVKSKKRTLKRCLTEANEEMAKLKKEVSANQEEAITSWQQKCNVLAAEVSQLQATVRDSEASKVELAHSLEQVTAEKESLVATVDRIQELNQQLEHANRALEEKVSSLTAALESAGSSVSSVPADSGSSSLVSDEELQRLRVALEEVTAQLASSQASLIALKQTSEDGFVKAGEKIANQEKSLELLWSQKTELEMELANTKVALAELHTDKVQVEANLINFRRCAKELKSTMLAAGTRFNVKDPKMLEFFHSL